MTPPTVSLVRVAQTEAAREGVWRSVERAMELAHWREFVPRGSDIALKPNLGWDLLLPGAVTSPWVVEGVVRVLRGWVGRIHLVESDQVVVNVERAFRLDGMDRICRESGVVWVNMTNETLRTVPLPGGRVLEEVQVPDIVLRMPLVTVPVMKTHNKTTITGAIKNQWGCLPMFRHNYHLVLDAALADINTIVRPCFAVMDATVGLEGNSPKSGNPRVVDRVLASGDFVALDAVAAKVMGFDPRSIGHIGECAAAGLGVSDLAQVVTAGDDDLALDLRFVPARHNLVSWFELVLRHRPVLRRIFFDTPVFPLCCLAAEAYYAAWYHVLGIGRARRDRILDRTRYGAQWRA